MFGLFRSSINCFERSFGSFNSFSEISFGSQTADNSSVGRELGFNKSKPKKKTGVKTCSSFTWARGLGNIRKIQDEYGRHYSRKEFLAMLDECPIQFHMEGAWFS